MSDLKKCPSCEKEVAKSAKVCPHCGKKLKMGMFLKLIIGIVVIVVIVIVAQPSSEDAQKTLDNKLDEILSDEKIEGFTFKIENAIPSEFETAPPPERKADPL